MSKETKAHVLATKGNDDVVWDVIQLLQDEAKLDVDIKESFWEDLPAIVLTVSKQEYNYAAYVGKTIVGFISVKIHDHSGVANIRYLLVAADYRKRGIGAQLVNRLEKDLQLTNSLSADIHCSRIMLNPLPQAAQFWANCGYFTREEDGWCKWLVDRERWLRSSKRIHEKRQKEKQLHQSSR